MQGRVTEGRRRRVVEAAVTTTQAQVNAVHIFLFLVIDIVVQLPNPVISATSLSAFG